MKELGQVNYEAWRDAMSKLNGWHLISYQYPDWNSDMMPPQLRAVWNAAALAVKAA